MCVLFYLRIDVGGRFIRYHTRNIEIITLSNKKNYIYFSLQVENLKLPNLIMRLPMNFHTYTPITPRITLYSYTPYFKSIFFLHAYRISFGGTRRPLKVKLVHLLLFRKATKLCHFLIAVLLT